MFQRGVELLPAAADEARPGLDLDRDVVRHIRSGPVHHLPIDQDLPGHDQPPGLLAALRQPERDQALIEALFHKCVISDK